jgi:hypothetical protein
LTVLVPPTTIVAMRFSRIRIHLGPTLLLTSIAGAGAGVGCGSVKGDADAANPDAPELETDAAPSPDAPIDAPMANVETPVNATTAGTVAEAGTLDLTGRLVTADADTGPGSLLYAIQALPTKGTLSKEGTALTIGGTFTQQDVNDGKLSYVHDGTEGLSDTFTWTLSDGVHMIPATGSTPFAITVTPVNDAPTIVNNPVTTLAEGGTEVFTASRLQAADAENGALTFTFTGITRGQLQRNNVALAVNGTFTQADIAAGLIRFIDPGTDDANLQNRTSTTATFQWRVSDPNGGVNPATGSNSTMFTITPVDDAATVAWKSQRCSASNVNILADPLTTLTDVDNPLTDYSLCVVQIFNGSYNIVNTTLGTTDTISVAPILQNGAVNLTVGSCVAISARPNLNLDFNHPGSIVDRGSVTWKLMKGAAQVGTDMNVFFPGPSTPSC